MPKSTNNIKILQGEPRKLDENKIQKRRRDLILKATVNNMQSNN